MTLALPSGNVGRITAAGLALLLVAAVWAAIVMPLIATYTSRAQAMDEREALVRRQAALVAQLPALQRQARRMRHVAPADDAFLAGATDAIAGATLEQLLQSMTSRSVAALSSAEALTPKADGRYQRIELRITVSSDWPALIRLFQEITTGRPSMLIDDLQVTATPVSDGAAPINAVFTVIAFRNATVHPGNVASTISLAPAP